MYCCHFKVENKNYLFLLTVQTVRERGNQNTVLMKIV